MKKILLSLFVAATCSLSTQARILTVNNTVGSVAMFTDVQMAIDSAKTGDTVFVHASATRYNGSDGGFVIIKRRIVLLGEGGKPNYAGLTSSLYALKIDSLAGIPVSGTVMQGIHTPNYIQILDKGIKGCIIKNCAFNAGISDFYGSGHIIANNIFWGGVSMSFSLAKLPK